MTNATQMLEAFSQIARDSYIPKIAILRTRYDENGGTLEAVSAYQDVNTCIVPTVFATNDANTFSVVNDHLHISAGLCNGIIAIAEIGGVMPNATGEALLMDIIGAGDISGRLGFAKNARGSSQAYSITMMGTAKGSDQEENIQGVTLSLRVNPNAATNVWVEFHSLTVIVF